MGICLCVVYDTCTRQLNVRSDSIEDAHHWSRGSTMALTYDSANCVLKLSTKECVRAAVAGGWRRVSAASLPNPAPMAPPGNVQCRGLLVLCLRSSCASSDGLRYQHGFTGLTYSVDSRLVNRVALCTKVEVRQTLQTY